ncbi:MULTISPECIES: MFS transporter [Nitrincola]|uniref:Glucose/mannose:H(+) symporter n=1 Tax=Nitrincola nitratireducens TaxID=1229521 RepID=W9UY15_9GAMM|nr:MULTISPECIES: MFS transporter [Nitrincola]EXJ11954.1 Glucose/mannose:H(+) symporter [Nitrincola nitratireducens]
MNNPVQAPLETPKHWRLTITYWIIFICIGMMGGILGPALPFLAEQSHSSMSQIALLFTARAMGNIIGSLVSGQLFDRYDGHKILLLMGVAAILGMLITPSLMSLGLLCIFVFILGYSEVSLNAGCNLMMIWAHKERAPPFISALHFCYGLGAMIIPLILIMMLALFDTIHAAFWLVSIALTAIMLFLLKQPTPDNPERQARDTPSAPYDKAVFGGLLLLFSLYVGMEMTFAGWIATYATLRGIEAADAAILVSIFWLSLSAGRLIAIPLLRPHLFTYLLCGCFALAVSMMLLMYFNRASLHLITLLFGLSMSAIFPTLFSLGSYIIKLNGKRTGFIFMAVGTGAMIVPYVAGVLLDHMGETSLPLLILVVLGLMIANLSFLLIRQKRTRNA